jgi:predicted amidophosphoribosyltransferase
MASVWNRMLDVVFPAQCAGCGATGTGLCDACAAGFEPFTQRRGTLLVRALGEYGGALRAAVLALKDGRRDVAQALGKRLATIVGERACVVPVPTTRARRRARGFDGCLEVARALCAATGAGCAPILTQRAGDAQRGRSRDDRLRARGRFGCTRDVTGARLVLLDDVCTTGATLLDCAQALRARGAIVGEAVVAAIATNQHGP